MDSVYVKNKKRVKIMSDSKEKKLILMVDDVDFYLTTAEKMLKDKYDIIFAKSGQEAIDHLVKGALPDIILLDIVMPIMDGWETYYKLKGIGLLRNIPVVFVTSLHGEDDVKYAYEIGAADYIMKPYAQSDLLIRIEKILNNTSKETDQS